MWRLLCLSLISVGCSDGTDSCGPHGAAADGIVTSGTGVTMTWGMLMGSPNADCGAAPVVSVTISGTQLDATGTGATFLTMCVPRPDHLGSGLTLNTDFIVQDVTGSAGACTYTLDATTPPTGTAKSSGLCNNGSSKAGFALTIDAQITLQRKCGAVIDSIPATLAGTAAVAGP